MRAAPLPAHPHRRRPRHRPRRTRTPSAPPQLRSRRGVRIRTAVPETRSSVGSFSLSRVLRRSTLAGSPHAPTSLARGDRRVRACRPFGTDALQRRNPETENIVDLQTLIAHWSGQVPPGFVPHAVLGKPETCVQPRCNKPRALKANGEFAKSCSGCLARRCALLPQKARSTDCRRRLPQVRVPKEGARRLPLRTLPRGPRHRARTEAPGRPRRGGDRRVRRQARDGAPREQSRPGDLAVERQAEEGTERRILVAVARSRAKVRAALAHLSHRFGLALLPQLIPPVAAGARHAASRFGTLQLPAYCATTAILSCPSSRAMVLRASLSIRRHAPVSDRRDGPPAAGDFHPVISS